jgi:hypothetical protein
MHLSPPLSSDQKTHAVGTMFSPVTAHITEIFHIKWNPVCSRSPLSNWWQQTQLFSSKVNWCGDFFQASSLTWSRKGFGSCSGLQGHSCYSRYFQGGRLWSLMVSDVDQYGLRDGNLQGRQLGQSPRCHSPLNLPSEPSRSFNLLPSVFFFPVRPNWYQQSTARTVCASSRELRK